MFLSLRICSDGLLCFCRDGTTLGHLTSRPVDADELGIGSCPTSTGCLLSVLLTSLFGHAYPSFHLRCIYIQHKSAVVPRTMADGRCTTSGFLRVSVVVTTYMCPVLVFE